VPSVLRNDRASFQQHVERAIRDCEDAFAWVDDISICSQSHEEHEVYIRQALQDNGLIINAEKCMWGVPELEYLGHKISVAGVLLLPSNVAAIQEFPPPFLIKELQAFLGIVNFYRDFLHSIARTLQPLTDKLRGARKGSENLEWSVATQAAFAAAKQALVSATHIAHPTLGADLSGSWTPREHSWCMSSAAASWQDRLAAPGLLLREAGGSPAEVFCF
jgi:hypothetical protein